MSRRDFCVYIMSSKSRTLYTGVTNDLARRVYERKEQRAGTFVARYRVTDLVYAERPCDAKSAIMREKQIKGWTRARKIQLVESVNPGWRDLSEDW